jgi:hypothetical protein
MHSYDISHEFDLVVGNNDGSETIERPTMFLEEVALVSDYDCAGTVGSAGTFGGTFGTIGTWGCCC